MVVVVRFILWILLTLIIIPTCLFIKRFLPKYKFLAPRVYHKLLCKVIGIEIEVRGEMSKQTPTLFVSNHLSYLDIPVLGSLIKGSFVSKGEVRNWPVIGFLATLQNTIFIKKQKRSEAGKQANIMVTRLHEGDSLIVFPEGTSWYGTRVVPFKTSLFSVAQQKVKYNEEEHFLKVQPISVHFAELNGEPTTYNDRQYYSWVGDEEMFPHLPRFFSFGKKKMIVEFHPMVSMDEFANRKEMAKYCEDVVSDSLSEKIAGR